MNKKKTISLASHFYLLYAKANKIEYYDDYYMEWSYYNAKYLGYGGIFKSHFHWFRRPTGSFYSGLGLGYVYGNITVDVDDEEIGSLNNILGLTWQIDLIGFQGTLVKESHFGTFLELGYGYEGILQFGFMYNW